MPSSSRACCEETHVLELYHSLPAHEGRLEQVGRTSDDVGELRSERFHDDTGRLASRLGGGRELVPSRKEGLPSFGKVATNATLQFLGFLGVGLGVASEEILPLLLLSSSTRGDVRESASDRLGDDELLVGVEAELLLDVSDLLIAEGLTVSGSRVLLARAESDGGANEDKGGSANVFASLKESVGDVGDLLGGILLGLGAASVDNVPSSSLEAKRDILGEAVVDGSIDSDLRESKRVSARSTLVSIAVAEQRTHLVTVVDEDEVVEAKMTSDRNGFQGLEVSFQLAERATERISPSWPTPS